MQMASPIEIIEIQEESCPSIHSSSYDVLFEWVIKISIEEVPVKSTFVKKKPLLPPDMWKGPIKVKEHNSPQFNSTTVNTKYIMFFLYYSKFHKDYKSNIENYYYLWKCHQKWIKVWILVFNEFQWSFFKNGFWKIDLGKYILKFCTVSSFNFIDNPHDLSGHYRNFMPANPFIKRGSKIF